MTGKARPGATEPEAYRGEVRVTADLDDAEPVDLYKAWGRFKEAGAYDIEARTSAGGEGFHLRGWFDSESMAAEPERLERLRLFSGDHPRRVWFDRTHDSKPAQILFTTKSGGEDQAGPWHGNPFDPADELRSRSERYGLAGWL